MYQRLSLTSKPNDLVLQTASMICFKEVPQRTDLGQMGRKWSSGCKFGFRSN